MALSQLLNWSLPAGVHACCTTRVGGVSLPPFESWNLGDHVGDDPLAVTTNRQRLQSQLGRAHAVFLQQVHGIDVVALDAKTPDGTVADACLTMHSNVACTVMVADCLPILLTDIQGRVVAAAHAGWRGLVCGVVESTLRAMSQHSGVKPSDVQVWLGPCIGPTAFEVGAEVREAFMAQDATCDAFFTPHSQRDGKWLANLSQLARLRLRAQGVTSISGNDGGQAWCTVAQASDFFSYRRDGVTGRFAACIWLSH
jgi:YfiH family protein